MSPGLLDVMTESQWTALGVLLALVTAVAGLIQWNRRRRSDAPNLRVEDVHLALRESAGSRVRWPSLSFTLRNTGRQTAVIGEVRCDALQHWRLALQGAIAFHVRPTHYDVEIDRTKPFPQTIQFGVTHALPTEHVDRIQLDFSALPAQGIEEIFHVSVAFRYGSTWTPPVQVVLVMPDNGQTDPDYFYGDFQRRMSGVSQFVRPGIESEQYKFLQALAPDASRIDAHNRAVLKDIATLPQRVTRTARVEELLKKASVANAAPQTSPDDAAAGPP